MEFKTLIIELLVPRDAKFYCAFIHILSLMHKNKLLYLDFKPVKTIEIVIEDLVLQHNYKIFINTPKYAMNI